MCCVLVAKGLCGFLYANESYEDFVSGLQKEIQDDAGVRFGIIEKHDFASVPHKSEIFEKTFELAGEYIACTKEVAGVIKKSIRKLNIKDASKKETIKLNKSIFLGEDFKELWDRIKYKTTFNVDFDSEKLKEKSINNIKAMPPIKNIRVITQTAKIE